MISRDRSGSCALAACLGAPQAKKMADRWHLLKNLREALQSLFDRLAFAVAANLPKPATLFVATSSPASAFACRRYVRGMP